MNATQRKNLLKLAAYLESLPRDYKHFDMAWFAFHRGGCKLPMDEGVYAAKQPNAFLANCGTVACAVGHGPAAGVGVLPSEYIRAGGETIGVHWHGYSRRCFGIGGAGDDFSFLFGGHWENIDNHHYGAAARIRCFLETGETYDEAGAGVVKKYAPYRKGSRSAKRREIETAVA